MDVDGKHLHRLLPGWSDPPHEESGAWAANGSYFFFQARREGLTNIWATEEKRSWLRRHQPVPVRITAGPEEFAHPMVAGRRVFVVGARGKTELIHFNPQSHQSTTLFANTDVWGATYSRDGQWAAVSATDGHLRKIRADGTEGPDRKSVV